MDGPTCCRAVQAMAINKMHGTAERDQKQRLRENTSEIRRNKRMNGDGSGVTYGNGDREQLS